MRLDRSPEEVLSEIEENVLVSHIRQLETCLRRRRDVTSYNRQQIQSSLGRPNSTRIRHCNFLMVRPNKKQPFAPFSFADPYFGRPRDVQDAENSKIHARYGSNFS